MTGIGKITKENNDGTVEVTEYSAPELIAALVKEQEVNDRNAQIACDTIAELSRSEERLQAELQKCKKALSESCDEQTGEYYPCPRAKRAEADRDGFMLLCQELGAKHASLDTELCKALVDVDDLSKKNTLLTAQVAFITSRLKAIKGLPGEYSASSETALTAILYAEQALSNLPAEAKKLMRVVEQAQIGHYEKANGRCNCGLCCAIRDLRGEGK